MARAARIECGESFVERVERLADELRLAIQWNRPSILLAVYQSRFVMLDAQAALAERLRPLGQQVEPFVVDAADNADVPLRLSQHPHVDNTVFFVEGLSFGGQAALRALNMRREYFVERRIRAVFWLTEPEAIAVARDAPDFWAFRHRAVDFMELPVPERAAELGRALAWSGLEDRTLRQDSDAKIALRLALLQDLPPGNETMAARAALQFTLGALYRAKGAFEESIHYLNEAIHAAQQLEDTPLLAGCYNGLGNAYAALGETRRAIEYYQQALAIAREIGDRRGEGNSLGNLGNAYADLGETRRAIEYYEGALAIAREIGDRRGEGAALGNLGAAYAALGETRRAHHYLAQALAIFEQIESPYADWARRRLAKLPDES